MVWKVLKEFRVTLYYLHVAKQWISNGMCPISFFYASSGFNYV